MSRGTAAALRGLRGGRPPGRARGRGPVRAAAPCRCRAVADPRPGPGPGPGPGTPRGRGGGLRGRVERLLAEGGERGVDAALAFVATREDNVRLYSVLLGCLSRREDLEGSRRVLGELRRQGHAPNDFTFTALVSTAGKAGDLGAAEEAFGEARALGCATTAVFNAMIDACGRCGATARAFGLLEAMAEVGVEPDTTTYNALMQTAGRTGDLALAQSVYAQLRRERHLAPTDRTFSILFAAAGRASREGDGPGPGSGEREPRQQPVQGRARWAFDLYDEMVALGVRPNSYVLSALFTACAREGKGYGQAQALVREFQAGGGRLNTAAWTAMISLCSACGEADEAVRIAHEHCAQPLDPYIRSAICSAIASGKRRDLAHHAQRWQRAAVEALKPEPSGLRGPEARAAAKLKRSESVAFNALIYMLGQVGLTTQAFQAYDAMQRLGLRSDIRTYNTLMLLRSGAADLQGAEDLLQEMKVAGMRPSGHTFSTLISMYIRASEPKKALRAFKLMAKSGIEPNSVHFTSLIHLYSRASAMPAGLDKADRVYKMMRRRGIPPNEVTLSCLVDACSKANDVERAFGYYTEACAAGIAPSDAAHNQLIKICAENNRLDDALNLVKTVVRNHGEMQESTLDSVVRVLSRQHVERAMRLHALMRALHLEPTTSTVRALVRACSAEGYPMEAFEYYRALSAAGSSLGPEAGSGLLQAQCRAGQVDRAVRVWDDMRAQQCWPRTDAVLAVIGACSKAAGQLPKALEILALFQEQPSWNELLDAKKEEPVCNLFDALINRCCNAGELADALALYDAYLTLSWESERRFGAASGLKLSMATLAFLENCCKIEDAFAHRAYDVLAEMRRQTERKRLRRRARATKSSHHFSASAEGEGETEEEMEEEEEDNDAFEAFEEAEAEAGAADLAAESALEGGGFEEDVA